MKNPKFHKLTAACMVGLFLLDFSYLPGSLHAAAPSEPDKLISADSFSIPSSLGKIDYRSPGSQPLQAVLIQDAHGIPDAQGNLARLLLYLQKEKHVKSVGVEGVSRSLDPVFFQTAPDQKKLKTILREQMKRGELSGIVWAAIFGEAGTDYYGIEDLKLYNQGLEFYLNAAAEDAKTRPALQSFQEKLARAKLELFSPELLKIDPLIDSLGQTYTALRSFLVEAGAVVAPEKGSALEVLRQWILDSESGKLQATAEFTTFADQFNSQLQKLEDSRPGSRRLASKVKALAFETQKFKTGASDTGHFASFLLRFNASLPAAQRVEMPEAVSAAAANQDRLAQLQGGLLQEELDAYVGKIYSQLAGEGAPHQAVLLTQYLRRISELLQLKLTRKHWFELLQLEETLFKSPAILSGLPVQSFLEELQRGTADARLFYSNALLREKGMQQNLDARLKNSGSGLTAVVTGGFHNEGLKDYFRRAGVRYAVVTPVIHELPEKNAYANQMAGEVSWGRYLVPDHGKLNFFKSFARSVRDGLLNGQEDPEAFLQEWRLRLLTRFAAADDGRASLKNAEYLTLLDTEHGAAVKTVVWPWARFDDFLNDLKQTQIPGSAGPAGTPLRSSSRPAEVTSAAVLVPSQSFSAAQMRRWARFPRGSRYQEIGASFLRSEVRHTAAFMGKVVKSVSGVLGDEIAITEGTDSAGNPELMLSHQVPYEHLQIQFDYRIIFHDEARIRTRRVPRYSFAGEEKKENVIYIPRPDADGKWDKKTLMAIRAVFRRMTIADPKLNKRFTTQGFDLLGYQKRAVRKLTAALEEKKKALGVMATATGKTVVAFHIAGEQLEKAKAAAQPEEDAGVILFVVNNIQVLSDAEKSWHRMFNGKHTTSRIYDSEYNDTGDVIFATPTSLGSGDRLAELMKKRKIRMVIVDEVHHLPAETPKVVFRKIEEKSLEENWQTQFLGLTATETRPDHESVIAFFGHDVHYEYSIRQGWRDGSLVKWKYKAGDLDINPENHARANPNSELEQKYRAMRYSNKRYPHLFKLYQKEAKQVPIPKGLIIASSVKKAEELASYFRKRGVNAVKLTGADRTADSVRFDHTYQAWKTGHWPEDSPWANEPVPEVVVGVDIFREGVDVPAINILMLMDDTNSTIQFVQSVGRGLRIAPFKNYIAVIDAVGLFRKLSLIRYLGGVSAKRRGPRGAGGGGDDDDDDQGTMTDSGHGLDENVTKLVAHFFNDAPSNLIYRYKLYENIPDSGFKMLDRWISKRARFEAVQYPPEQPDPEEKTLMVYLRNFIHQHMLDPDLLTDEAKAKFRARFVHVFDIDAALSQKAEDPFVTREESYLVFRRLGVLFHQADNRVDIQLLQKIYPEFDENHQTRLRNRALNLAFFRKSVLQLNEKEALRHGRKMIVDAKASAIILAGWDDHMDDYLRTGDASASIFRLAEEPMDRGHVGLLGSSNKKRQQFDEYSQNALLQVYLFDPRYKGKLTPGDFSLSPNDFITKLQQLLLMDDAETLSHYVAQLDKAVLTYIGVLRTENQRHELPELRTKLLELTGHEFLARAVGAGVLEEKQFKKWFDLFWRARQEGHFGAASEEPVKEWFMKLAGEFGFLYSVDISGLSHVRLQVYRSSTYVYEVSLLAIATSGSVIGQHTAPVTITPAGDVFVESVSTGLSQFFETLDARAQGLVMEELLPLLQQMHAAVTRQGVNMVVIVPPEQNIFSDTLAKAVLEHTAWDLFSMRAVTHASEQERARWRLGFLEDALPGEKTQAPAHLISVDTKKWKAAKMPADLIEVKKMAAEIAQNYYRYINFWNYYRVRALEGLKGLDGLTPEWLSRDDMIGKAIPLMRKVLQKIADSPTAVIEADNFTVTVFELSNALGFYKNQTAISEEQRRLANGLLAPLQRRPRNYFGNLSYETLGPDFENWRQASRVAEVLRKVTQLDRQVYSHGDALPASFWQAVSGFLEKIERNSASLSYHDFCNEIDSLINRLEGDLALGRPLADPPAEEVEEQESASAALKLPMFFGGALYVISAPKPGSTKREIVYHMDPTHDEIPKGGKAHLVEIDDADRFGSVCEVCFLKAMAAHPDIDRSVKDLQDFASDQSEAVEADPSRQLTGVQHLELEERLRRSEVRIAQGDNAAQKASDLGRFFLFKATGSRFTRQERSRLEEAAALDRPRMETVFDSMRDSFSPRPERALEQKALVSDARSQLRDFMRQEFSETAQGRQGIVFGIRLASPEAAAAPRSQRLIQFIADFLPQSDQTSNHAVITGKVGLHPELRTQLSASGIHTLTGRKVAALVSQYGQGLFPEIILDASQASRTMDMTPRSIELREAKGVLSDTENLAVELEAVHAFALARYGDGEGLREFYRRLSRAVTVFKQYPDMLYSSIIKPSGPNSDYVDVEVLSSYLHVLTAQMAALHQLSSSA